MPFALPEQPTPPETGASTAPPGGDAERAASLWRYAGPRYWPVWLFLGWLWLTAQLPWATAIALHRWLGRAIPYLLPSLRRIATRNLQICFPDLAPAEIATVTRQHFENLGASFAEIAIAWFGHAPRSRPPVQIEGLEHLHAALAKGKGVILYSGHFTTLELTTQFIKPLVPLYAFMYRRRNNPLLDEMQTRGRRRTAHVSFANTASRAMLRMLQRNAVVWYAPDQAHRGKGSELLPFFGEPAMTNTAAARLARISGATVLPLQFLRLDGSAGYCLRFAPPLDALPSDNLHYDTTRLTAVLESFIRDCPAQYFWTHRKFKGRGGELPDAYARAARPAAAVATPSSVWSVLGEPLLIVAVALFIVAFDNGPMWRAAAAATQLDEHRLAILWSMFSIVFFTLTTLLSLAFGTRLLKVVAAALLLIAATAGFFMSEYGIVIDESMIRNIAETATREAAPLLGTAFYQHLFFYGVVPAVAVFFVRLGSVPWRRALLVRLGIAALGVTVMIGSVYANFAAVSFFGHQNHTLRLLMNPGYPLYATARFAFGKEDTPTVRALLDARLAAGFPETKKPALVIFVMGETARADRFSFNGYARDTNRYTRPLGVVNFPTVTSCGTSTSDSVPCVFSGLGRRQFTHAGAAQRESLLGTLTRLGVDAAWRDNSTGCKNVCEPEDFEQLATRTDADFCDTTGCFDEILLKDFDALLTDATRDHVIVFHQRGSHGPAYHTDTPAWIKTFTPECDLPNLRNCDREAINNAYDNTILYADYFLSRVIATLEERSDDFDTAMLYVSDHGESLGENGLYLHGFPYTLAPPEQTRVPMLFWASPGFYADRAGITPECLRSTANRATSHDAIYHTLLPLFGVDSPAYQTELDLFSECRRSAG